MKRLLSAGLLTTAERAWLSESQRHDHSSCYYNDSECHGCDVLRETDSALAGAGHAFANLTDPTQQADSPVSP